MPIATVTSEVMKALPQALRPNPYNIDDQVMALISKGWTPGQIVEKCIRSGDRQPGHVVTTIRSLIDAPAPSDYTPRNQPQYLGHQPCEEHGEPCQLCYCVPGPPSHHINATQATLDL